jgi:acyl transferase domain-containing protein/acyl carrier protein
LDQTRSVLLIDENTENYRALDSVFLYDSMTVAGCAKSTEQVRSLTRQSSCVTGQRVVALLHMQQQQEENAMEFSTEWKAFKHSFNTKIASLRALYCSLDVANLSGVLFSSVSSFLGDAGQASSAASGFLDGFAECKGRRCISASWGPIENSEFSSCGARFEGISRVDAVELLDLCFRGGENTSFAVMRVDWDELKRSRRHYAEEDGKVNAQKTSVEVLDGNVAKWAKKLLRVEGMEDFTTQMENKQLQQQLQGIAKELEDVSKQAKLQQAQKSILNFVSGKLGIVADEITINAPLVELGFDSLTLVTIAEAVRDEFGVKCEDFFFLEFGTLLVGCREIARRMSEESSLFGQPFEGLGLLSTSVPPVALAGMSFRFPGARCVSSFWSNQLSLVSTVRSNFRPRGFNGPNNEMRFASVCDWMSLFDNTFFHVSPLEASVMDPQHRVVLEETYHAIEDAGFAPQSLEREPISVFCGVSKNDFAELMREEGAAINPFVSTGTVHSLVSNRVSYYFNLLGQSVSLDTACSSSLVAVSLAVADCFINESEMAIAIGVNALISGTMFVSHSMAGMLSKRGRCATFDSSADGYVRGEGVAALLLSRKLDSSLVHIVASNVQHGGKAAGLTVPSVHAQSAVLERIYSSAKVTAPCYIECHGTATQLGDPIEFAALFKCFQDREREAKRGERPNHPGLVLGAVKSLMGHLESCAGMAGIVKVALSLRYQTIAPIMHFTSINKSIPIVASRFTLPNEAISLKHMRNAICGVSSFGMGGVNAHVVAKPNAALTMREEKCFNCSASHHRILISAEKGQLNKLVESFSNYLIEIEANLCSVAVGMGGRNLFSESVSVVVSSFRDLHKKLHTKASSSSSFTVANPCSHSHRVTQLPKYVFRENLIWYRTRVLEKPTIATTKQEWRIPETTFFLRDHVVQNSVILPGVFYLELSRMTVKSSAPHLGVCALKDIEWHAPSVPSEGVLDLDVRFDGEKIEMFVRQRMVFSCRVSSSQAFSSFSWPYDADLDWMFSKQEVYLKLKEHGLNYGPSMNAIENFGLFSENKIGCSFIRKGDLGPDLVLHPSLLDGAFQTVVLHHIFSHSNGATQFLPFSLLNVCWSTEWSVLPDCCLVMVEDVSEDISKSLSYNIRIVEANSKRLVVEFIGFLRRPNSMVSTKQNNSTPSIYVDVWNKQPLVTPNRSGANLLVLASQNFGCKDWKLFESVSCEIVVQTDMNRKFFDELFTKYQDKIDAIVIAWDDLNVISILHLVQSLLSLHVSCPIFRLFSERLVGDNKCLASMIGGFARTLIYESPLLPLVSVWMEDASVSCEVAIANCLSREEDFDLMEVRFAQSSRFVRGLELSVNVTATKQKSELFGSGKTYLISGGLGGIGMILSLHLGKTYGSHIVLLGRRDPDENQIETLRKVSGSVLYFKCDVCDLLQLQQAIPHDVLSRVNGVIHCAGLIRDSFIISKSVADFVSVAAPKLTGSVNLDLLTQNSPLDFFVMCSSIAAVLPNQGQVDYASANSFMDTFATERTGKGHGLSIGWSLWESGGMQVTDEEKLHLEKNFGIFPLATNDAIFGFEQLLSSDLHHAVIANPSARIFSKKTKKQTPNNNNNVLDLRKLISDVLIDELMLQPDELQDETAFSSLGLSSMVISSINSRLEEQIGQISKTLFFEFVNLKEILAHFARLETKRKAAAPKKQRTKATKAVATLHRKLISRVAKNVCFCDIDLHDQHVHGFFINERSSVPGGCFLEFAMEAFGAVFGKHVICVRDNFWPNPMFLNSDGKCTMSVTFSVRSEEEVNFVVSSNDIIHATGGIGTEESENDLHFYAQEENFAAIISAGTIKTVSSDAFYNVIEENAELHLEGKFRLIQEMREFEDTAVSTYELSEDMDLAYQLHPVVVTGVEQTLLVFTALKYKHFFPNEEMRLMPVAIELAGATQVVPRSGFIVLKSLTKVASSNLMHKVDAFVLDQDLNCVAVVKGNAMRIQRVSSSSSRVIAVSDLGLSNSFSPRSAFILSRAVRVGDCWSGEELATRLQGPLGTSLRDMMVPITPDRWKESKDAPNWACLLEGASLFDNSLFSISPKEAVVMDPQHRMVLECSFEVLRDHLFDSEKNIGVYVGIGKSEYALRAATLGIQSSHFETGNWNSGAAGRVSYTFDLCGRSISFDTACSSSLVSVISGLDAIRMGVETNVIAGGVNLICNLGTTINYNLAGMLSPDGRCKTFDAAANGYARGEGCGMVFLSRNSREDMSDDCIVAGCINQDGRSAGLTAPNGTAQQKLIRSALSDGNISNVNSFEAHGTGTPLGDPIEINAILNSAENQRNNNNSLIVSSVKANIGHLETAAGILSLLKVLLEFDNDKKFCQIHFQSLNPQIFRLEEGNVVFPVEEIEMRKKHCVGINSFGFTGTNAHVIVRKGSVKLSPLILRRKNRFELIRKSFVDVLDATLSNVLNVSLKKHSVVFYVEQKRKIAVPSSFKLAFRCSEHFKSTDLKSVLKYDWDYLMPGENNVVRLRNKDGFVTESGCIAVAVAVWSKMAEWGIIFQKVFGNKKALKEIGFEKEKLLSVGDRHYLVETGREVRMRDNYQISCFHAVGKHPRSQVEDGGKKMMEFVRNSFWIGVLPQQKKALKAVEEKKERSREKTEEQKAKTITKKSEEEEDVFVVAVDLVLDPPYVLADHLVYNIVIMPGASHLSRIVQICSEKLTWQKIELSNVVFLTPVILDLSQEKLVVNYKFTKQKGVVGYKWEVSTNDKLHARGEAFQLLQQSNAEKEPRLNFRTKNALVSKAVKLKDRGLAVTEDYALIEHVLVAEEEQISCAKMRELKTRFVAATQYLDAMFLTCVSLMSSESLEHFWAPFALSSFRFFGERVSGETFAEGKLLTSKESRATFQCRLFRGQQKIDGGKDNDDDLMVEMDRFTILEAPKSSMFPPQEYYQRVALKNVNLSSSAKLSVNVVFGEGLLSDVSSPINCVVLKRDTDLRRISEFLQKQLKREEKWLFVGLESDLFACYCGAFVRCIAQEQTESQFRFVLFDHMDAESVQSEAFALLHQAQGWVECSYGKSVRSEPELVLAQTNPNAKQTISDCVCISGGFGALGIVFANWCVKTNRNVALLGRSGLTTTNKNLCSSSNVGFVRVDASSEENVYVCLSLFELVCGRSVSTVLHLAGVARDALYFNQNSKSLKESFVSKVGVFKRLWQSLSCRGNQVVFVLFSSISSVMGNQGQSNYSAANGFLDFFSKKQQSGNVFSVNWGPWGGSGMFASVANK